MGDPVSTYLNHWFATSLNAGLLTIYNSSHAEWRWHRVACVFQNKDHEPVKLTKFTYDAWQVN